jgi:hypothetical protein
MNESEVKRLFGDALRASIADAVSCLGLLALRRVRSQTRWSRQACREATHSASAFTSTTDRASLG